MSLLLALLGGAPVAPDQIWPEETDIVSLGLDSEDTELSFTYGPLPDDVIAAVDLLVNVFDDAHEAEETDYSFTFTLLEDAQLYAAQFETEEAADETDHSFAAGPLSDDFVAPDEKVYSATTDDDRQTDDEGEIFTFTLLEDAQIYGLQVNDETSDSEDDFDFVIGPLSDDFVAPDDKVYGLQAEDEPQPDEFDDVFILSLQDEFVVVDELPYQHFDEYDDAFEGDEYSFYLGAIGADEVIVPPVTGQGDGDISRRKKPIVTVRPKAERDLDEVLELVSEVSAERRVSENKKTVKAALTAIKAVEAAPNYRSAIAAIQKALTNVSRATAKHEGLQQAMVQISLDIETLVAEMERNRKRRRREEEEIILWLALT
jgi:hypothetical protein